MQKENALIKTITQLVEAGKYEKARQAFVDDLNENGKQADDVLEELLERCNKWLTNTENAYLYCLRGTIYNALKEYDKALEDFNRSIELKPDYAEAYNNRGIVYYFLEKYDKAIEEYIKAIELKPDYVEAYNNRGVVYSDLRDYNKGIEDYNKAIELKPDYAIAYNNRGNAYYNLKDYNKAIADYTKAIGLKLEDNFMYLRRAKAYEALEEYEKAIADFKAFFEKTDNTYLKQQAKSEIERLKEILDNGGQFLEIIENAIENIKKELLYEGETITHYTNMGGAKALLLNKDSLFRLSEAHYMNDTAEGEQLNKAVGDVSLTVKDKLPFIAKPFLGSFVGDDMDNYLNLWRMYAKTNGDDGCGCAITLNREEFLNTIRQFVTSSTKKEDVRGKEVDEIISFNRGSNNEDFECYSVAYLNKKNKCIDSDYSEAINNELTKISAALKSLNEKAPNKLNSAYERLSSIAYLFKSEEYQYEKEIRIIIKNSANPEHVIVDNADYFTIPRVYHNIGNIHSALKSVTIGPKVERSGEWQTVFKYSFKQNPAVKNEVEVYISKLPYK